MFPVHEASSQVSLMSPMLQQLLLLCPVKSGYQALQLLSCTVGEGGYVGGGLGTGEGGDGEGVGDGGGGDSETIAALPAPIADGAGGSGEGGLGGARDTPQTS
jgi:hypothetical protein